MIKVCKIRIYPNKTQEKVILLTLDACRTAANLYIEYVNNQYEIDKTFVSAYQFSNILTQIKHNDPEYMWLQKASSAALIDALTIQETAYKNFFRKVKNKEKVSLPQVKERDEERRESFRFVKGSVHFDTGKKNIIKLPILKNMRITERDYLPPEESLISGRVIREDKKYYAIFIYNAPDKQLEKTDVGYAISVGLNCYVKIANTANDEVEILEHFNKLDTYQKYTAKIERLQRIVSKKAEINLEREMNAYRLEFPDIIIDKKIKKELIGRAYGTGCVKNVVDKIRRVNTKKTNIRKNYINNLVNELVVKRKPSFLIIENLVISEMLQDDKDNAIHRYIQESGFYYFKERLTNKCKEYGVELRLSKDTQDSLIEDPYAPLKLLHETEFEVIAGAETEEEKKITFKRKGKKKKPVQTEAGEATETTETSTEEVATEEPKVEEVPVETPVEEEKPAPKKRGRKKKSEQVETPMEEPVEEKPAPKKRGRKKKSEQVEPPVTE